MSTASNVHDMYVPCNMCRGALEREIEIVVNRKRYKTDPTVRTNRGVVFLSTEIQKATGSEILHCLNMHDPQAGSGSKITSTLA